MRQLLHWCGWRGGAPVKHERRNLELAEKCVKTLAFMFPKNPMNSDAQEEFLGLRNTEEEIIYLDSLNN